MKSTSGDLSNVYKRTNTNRPRTAVTPDAEALKDILSQSESSSDSDNKNNAFRESILRANNRERATKIGHENVTFKEDQPPDLSPDLEH